jgi:Phosphoesterase family
VGPGTRVPALVVSPFAKKGYVDHTVYDTGSILRLVTRVFGLETLDGLKLRDDAMRARTDADGRSHACADVRRVMRAKAVPSRRHRTSLRRPPFRSVPAAAPATLALDVLAPRGRAVAENLELRDPRRAIPSIRCIHRLNPQPTAVRCSRPNPTHSGRWTRRHLIGSFLGAAVIHPFGITSAPPTNQILRPFR